MSLFKPAVNTQAFLKMGMFGQAGSGKTYTGAKIATGFLEDLRKRDPQRADKPIMFLDTEGGVSYVLPLFTAMDAQVQVAQTRAFTDLLAAVKEAEQSASILIIDSITHFWTEFTDAYVKKNNRSRGLQFQDWAFLKKEWRQFTDLFLNSNLHILLLGRAGFEYDYHTDEESGKRELEKTGVKMKAENDMGYEPSLLMLMERHQVMSGGTIDRVFRTGTIIKDRTARLDGKVFENPSYDAIKPHVECLNIGGAHISFDATRNSDEIIPEGGKPLWQYRKEEKERALEEIKDLLLKHWPSTSATEKEEKAKHLEEVFGSRTWSRIETMDYTVVINAREQLWQKLEGKPYKISVSVPIEETIA